VRGQAGECRSRLSTGTQTLVARTRPQHALLSSRNNRCEKLERDLSGRHWSVSVKEKENEQAD